LLAWKRNQTPPNFQIATNKTTTTNKKKERKQKSSEKKQTLSQKNCNKQNNNNEQKERKKTKIIGKKTNIEPEKKEPLPKSAECALFSLEKKTTAP
jgi:phage protein D